MKQKICDLIDMKFSNEDGNIFRYDSEDNYIVDVLNSLFEENNISQYSVGEDIFFDSPGYDTGAIFIAWIELNGKLETLVFQWELM